MQPLHILQLNSLLTGGGTDDHCVKVTHGLRKLGHDAILAGPTGREFSTVAEELGVPLRAVPPKGPLKLSLIFGTARLIRRERFQILHAHHGRDYWPAVLAARLSGARPRIVLSRHLAKSPGSWMSRNFLLSQCDAMVAVSEFVSGVLRRGDADPASDNPERHNRPPIRGDFSKIHVVYGGIDVIRFKPEPPSPLRTEWQLKPEHYAFAVIGGYGLPRGKGQREFLRAAAKIKGVAAHARFLIVGRGNMKEILEADIEQLGLKGIAWLTPYCHDMPAAMNAIDCLVHPQIGTESWGNVVCEAHACGKPVIASNLDGIPEAFAAANYGNLVPTGSVEALASAMADWARKPKPTAQERANLHARVTERYSLERAASNLVALYSSLLQPQTQPVKTSRP